MKKLLLILLLCVTIFANAQNVGINGDGSIPDSSAMLDVKAIDKGVLIPRVQLDDANNEAPINGPAEGLMIYNQSGAEAKGFWYWDGNKWVNLSANSNSGQGGAVGAIIPYGASSIPSGFLLCDGSEVSRTTYADLFAVIGTAWGTGDGSTTFNLPDLRGHFLRGVNQGSGNDPNAGSRTALNGGNTGDNVGSYQDDATARPNSNFITNNSGSHRHTLILSDNGYPDGSGDRTNNYYMMDDNRGESNYDEYTNYAGLHSHSITGGGDAETRPKNANVNFIIQYELNAGGGQVLSLLGNDLSISNGNTVSLPISPAEDSTRITDADSDTKIQVERLVDEDIIHFEVNGVEAMTIDSSANVGLGETNPDEKLHIKNGSLKIDDGTNPYTFPNADGAANQVLQTDGSGNLTWTNMVQGGLVGSIIPFGGTTTPSGFLVCDGSEVDRTIYADLFDAIGTAWGNGDGSTTFNLPDLRGRFIRGLDGGAGNDPNAGSRTALNGGNTGDNVGSYQNDATARPNSNFTTNYSGYHRHTLLLSDNGYPDGSGDRTNNYYMMDNNRGENNYDEYTTDAGNHAHSITGGGDAETRPKNAYVSFIIQYAPGAGSSGGGSFTQSLSLAGNDLTISNGNTVSLPIGQAEDSTRITDADGNTKIQVEESANEDVIRFDVAGTETMLIHSSGNIGIGEPVPTEKVHIKNGSLRIDDGSNPYTLPSTDGTANQILQTDGSGNLSWIDAPTATVDTVEAWQTPTLLNGTLNYNTSSYNEAGYYKDRERVYLKGLLSQSNSVTLFTLPAGYRPPASILLTTYTGINIRLEPNGDVVRLPGSSNLLISLENISFRVN